MGESDGSIKRMRLRRDGVCACGAPVSAGADAGWDRVAREVVCRSCLGSVQPAGSGIEVDPPASTPGGSLRREYDRRRRLREERIRARHTRLGGLILALTDEPPSTRAFESGALGEERLAARLERDCGEDVLFLHNRRLGPGRRDGDIDHLAIAPSGIHVIDAKRYPEARVRAVHAGGLFSPRTVKLVVSGRDRSTLLDGAEKQVAAVANALTSHPLASVVPIAPYLCFVDADLPVFGTLKVGATRILGARALVRALKADGVLEAGARQSLWRHLATALPPA